MNRLALFLVAAASVGIAQTAPKHSTSTAHTGVAHARSTAEKLPPGIPPVHTPIKTAFTLRYQDIKIGTGPEAQSNKVYKVFYTGWRAADGVKFDSSDEHVQPVLDKDGKPELGPDGKPKMGEPQPLVFPQGYGRLIPGFDQGFHGMHVGGKRRIFIPWQLGYGNRDIPAHGAEHPGIPARSDLIFDVELVGTEDMPMPMERPMGAAPAHPAMPPNPHTPGAPAAPGIPPNAGKPATPPDPDAGSASQPATPPKPE